MSTWDKLTDRFLGLLGLDLDMSFSLGREPFNAIADELYLGARPNRAQTSALKEAGITHVASCLPEQARDKVAFLQDEFHTLFIPMHDGIREDIASVFPVFFDFVREAPKAHAKAKILVHCEVGVSRSATFVIALLMKQQRKRFFETYCDVRARRPEILPNIGFASQLQRFEFEVHPGSDDGQRVSSLARYLKEVCMVPVDLDTLQTVLHQNDYDALASVQAIFGDEIPRVIQGVRV